MNEVIDGAHYIEYACVNVYLVRYGDGRVLVVDTGLPAAWGACSVGRCASLGTAPRTSRLKVRAWPGHLASRGDRAVLLSIAPPPTPGRVAGAV